MAGYFKKLFWYFIGMAAVVGAALANWLWPFYDLTGYTTLTRFIWLGIFFIILDVLIEIILSTGHAIQLMTDNLNFSIDIHKLSEGFQLASKVSLSNNVKADYIAIGSSGVWLVNIKDSGGMISFNGEELVQNEKVLKGLITGSLEKSYSLAQFLKKNLSRDFIVTPVIAFSSLKADLNSVPKTVRGVRISSRPDIVSLIENTDVQLIDQKTSEEIYKLLKK